MTYTLITDQNESAQAFEAFRAGFARGAKAFPGHTVGFQGGNKQCDVYWHRDLGIWGLFEPRAVKGRFWTCFGTENPSRHANLNITVEINPPTSGVNLHCGGAFVRDEADRIYIGHSGKVGGGRKGVGKAAFREFPSDREWELIRVSGSRRLEVTILGQVGSQALCESIKSFVKEVAEFKRLYAGGTSRQPSKKAGAVNVRKSGSAKAPSGKYLPLYKHLLVRVGDEWQATFAEIERILGFALPKSANSYPAWWSNGSGMPHSAMWLDAGWRTEDLNLTGKTVHFARDTVARTKPTRSKQSNSMSGLERSKTPIASSKMGKTRKMRLRYKWAEIGVVTLDEKSRLVFPRLPNGPGIYRFHLAKGGKGSVYIGETDNLQRRFQHYRTPGPSQATNIRLNKIFADALKSGGCISVEVILNTAWICTEKREEQANLSKKSERVLFEHAAIIRLRSDDVHILNK